MPNPQRIEAVIFDMDGILVNSEPFWAAAEKEVFALHGIDPQLSAQSADTTGLRIDQVVQLVLTLAGKPELDDKAIAAQIIQRVNEEIKRERPIMPGVGHALNLCQRAGLKIGLASASPMSMIRTVVSLFELHPYFITLSSAELLPYSKPHPQVYLNAATALNVDPLHCLAIEDSQNGLIAAKAARMRVISVPAAEQAHLPAWQLADHCLHTLNDLQSIMLA